MATNPAVSLPRAAAMRKAMAKLDLFVVSENVLSNDTVNSGAHILLPAAAWGEKDGTVTNSERTISRQRAFLPLPGEAKPDWWIVTEVARRMGFTDAFRYRSAADVFREHAALSAFENNGKRDFDIGRLATLDDDDFNALDPVQWPARAGAAKGETRFFADGRFFTPDGKARLIAPEAPSLSGKLTPSFPLRLNTGRIRDQWHTMTRSGLSPKLGAHSPEPFVEVHPADAKSAGLKPDGFARVRTAYGACVLKVVVTETQRRGSLFAPIHWSGENAASARIGELIAPANDRYSGQPEAKATPAAIEPVVFAYRGFAIGQGAMRLPPETCWTNVTIPGGVGVLIASNLPPAAWRERAAAILGDDVELAEYFDEPRATYRAGAFHDGKLSGCLFIGPAGAVPQWNAVKALFEAETVGDLQRRAALSGKSTDGVADAGPLVCACFGVGLNTIRLAFDGGEVANVEDIGKVLHAGTNCGSCLPELKRIVAHGRAVQHA
jgi:assimilatory nitrate reductase catalytic subunit